MSGEMDVNRAPIEAEARNIAVDVFVSGFTGEVRICGVYQLSSSSLTL